MSERLKRLQSLRSKRISEADPFSDDQPLRVDPKLPFDSDTQERWTYDDGHIYLNGEEVSESVRRHRHHARELMHLSTGLSEYHDFVVHSFQSAHDKFRAAIDILQQQIFRRLSGMYTCMTSGVDLEMEDGRFWLNNVDLVALMRLYRLRPTSKARAYLTTFRDKLSLILESEQGNHYHTSLRQQMTHVFDELCHMLSTTPTIDTPHLDVAFGGSE